MKSLVLFQVFMVLSVFSVFVLSKECTNIPTELSSHTVRYELSISNNETWKKEMFSHYHLTPPDDSVWASIRPRKTLRGEDELSWAMMYKMLKNSVGANGVTGLLNEVTGLLSEVSLHDVRLYPNTMHWQAQKTNLEYLLMLDVDSLVWSFRKTAGLDAPGVPYGGWEAPNCELRGHFVGHYLSASAQMWASTHNDILKEKMSAVVSALSACQEQMGTGYLSAFPSEQFDRVENITPVWAPYYTIHKILAGLLDQNTLAGNTNAIKMVTWMVDYFYNRVQNVISKYTIERHWRSLNEESGGMNDVLYRLYSITGNQKHLTLAHLFDKPCFLGLLAVKADHISGFHANTHIPVVIGSQYRYEVTGDPLYKEIATYFMDIVNSSHSYATGGTSVNEFWSDPKRLASTLQSENEESCTTYNMLKVSRNLFRWTKEMAYADYYERALTNGVLGIQRGQEPGAMIYMLPLSPGSSKARSYHGWGKKFDTFWCCQGTGIESFSKLGDSIYFEEVGNVPTLYIIQYISSSLDWRSGHIFLSQEVVPVTSWDPHLRVTLTMSSNENAAGSTSTLNLRIPLWTYSDGAKASFNGQELHIPAPGNFLSITRKWSHGDKVTLELPISFRTEAIKDDRGEYASLHAILYGPYLLAGLSNGDWDINTESSMSFSDWITPVPADYNSHLISLSQQSVKVPFFLSNVNHSIRMESFPQEGTDSALSATFRLIPLDAKSTKLSFPTDYIGKTVVLEPLSYPGMLVMHQGEGNGIGIIDSSQGDRNSVFQLIAGLDGENGTISLELVGQKGCYVYGGTDYSSGAELTVLCPTGLTRDEFKQGASFTLGKGLSEYHPISFIAKGATRNFLLMPLLSLRDESYTVYFNFQS